MRRKWAVLIALLALPALCAPALALTGQEALERQEELIQVDELQRAAEQSGGQAQYGDSLDEGLENLLDTGTQELGGAVRTAARSGALLLVILLFCALTESLGQERLKTGSRAAALAGTLAVTAVAVADVNSLLGMGTGAIEKMSSFANVLLPAVTVASAATGAVTMDFVLMEKSAAKAIQKHENLRYFAPDVNQAKDAHLWQYRLFHDLFVMDNKRGLIYAYTATAPTNPTE